MKLRTGLIISIALHLALLLYTIVLYSGGGNGTGDGQGNGTDKNGRGKGGSKYEGKINANVIPKDRPVEVSLVQSPKEKPELIIKKQNKPKKIAKNADKECPGAWYGGIGIRQGPNDSLIEVYSGYPADLAGLEKDDIVVSTEGEQILGAPGTKLSLTVNRKGQILHFIIIRGKICYKN